MKLLYGLLFLAEFLLTIPHPADGCSKTTVPMPDAETLQMENFNRAQ